MPAIAKEVGMPVLLLLFFSSESKASFSGLVMSSILSYRTAPQMLQTISPDVMSVMILLWSILHTEHIMVVAIPC
jgi:hypothetical protein